MKNYMRLVGLMLFCLTLALPALALPPIMGDCEEADPESGSLMCGYVCKSTSLGSSCGTPTTPQPSGSYCWQAYLYNTSYEACHQGNYDECCDTGGQF
ncbi:MAG TPA: hypothetical protein VE974_14965 [Thermoanaerobaculia bacterium]|nr:hypothetical protein [Thermoanaerobaculia bacterium]